MYFKTVTRTQIFGFTGEFYKEEASLFFRKVGSGVALSAIATSTVGE